MESGVDQGPLPLPDGYPHSSMDEHIVDQHLLAYHGITLSAEEKKEALVIARNSIEILSSMLNSETKQKPVKDDDLTSSMLEKCKQSQPIIQRIIETTTDDEGTLFEALNLHEELQNILSKYGESEDAAQSVSGQLDGQNPDTMGVLGEPTGQATAAEEEAEKLVSSAREDRKTSSGSTTNG